MDVHPVWNDRSFKQDKAQSFESAQGNSEMLRYSDMPTYQSRRQIPNMEQTVKLIRVTLAESQKDCGQFKYFRISIFLKKQLLDRQQTIFAMPWSGDARC